MRLLDRYLLRELLVPLGYCLCGFLILWIFFDLFAELNRFQNNKLRPEDIATYYAVNLPTTLVTILPITLLLALLYALTNHARNHEITAMRAAGISLWRMCLPYLAVGFFASLLLFVLNEFVAPPSAEAAERILNRRVSRPAGSLGPNQIPDFGFNNAREGRKWKAQVYNLETGQMTNPIVVRKMSDGSSLWLSAERADWANGVWTFYNASEFKADPEKESLLVPLLQTNVLALSFPETPAEIKSDMKLSLLLSRFPTRGTKRAEIPITEILNYLRFHPHVQGPDGWRLFTNLHGRLATPWTCLVVVLIAIPFGAAQGRRNVFVGVASSISICVIFFVLQQLGLTFGSIGWVPPWLGAWLPNLCFGLSGLWLTTRVR
jgi:lipopolysaccharide export system permease protein